VEEVKDLEDQRVEEVKDLEDQRVGGVKDLEDLDRTYADGKLLQFSPGPFIP
jgi:hypothetical protein